MRRHAHTHADTHATHTHNARTHTAHPCARALLFPYRGPLPRRHGDAKWPPFSPRGCSTTFTPTLHRCPAWAPTSSSALSSRTAPPSRALSCLSRAVRVLSLAAAPNLAWSLIEWSAPACPQRGAARAELRVSPCPSIFFREKNQGMGGRPGRRAEKILSHFCFLNRVVRPPFVVILYIIHASRIFRISVFLSVITRASGSAFSFTGHGRDADGCVCFAEGLCIFTCFRVFFSRVQRDNTLHPHSTAHRPALSAISPRSYSVRALGGTANGDRGHLCVCSQC